MVFLDHKRLANESEDRKHVTQAYRHCLPSRLSHPYRNIFRGERMA